MRRPGRSLQGLSSTVSPPSSPPAGDLDPPLFDFSLFHPDRSRGKNARLPVAVTSTLHSDLPPANDLVLQALLGDATSFAASSASQLPSAAAADRQHIQNTLAQQRIRQVAASAQELLQGTGPSFPSHTSNRFPSPPQHLPSDLDSIGRDRAFASLLQLPNQLVSSVEHYEPQGSGRPGRMHGQQPSFQSPSQSWIHRPVPSRHLSDFGAALSPLPSPPALINTQQQQQHQQQQRQMPSSIQSMLPWDSNRWGGLPIDVEANMAQSFRLRDQQQQQPQLQADAQRQQQQQQYRMPHSAPLGAAAMDAAHGPGLRHLTGDRHRQQTQTLTFLPSCQSPESQAGLRDQMGSPFQYMPQVTSGTTPPEQHGFSEFSFSNDEASNNAFTAYSRRIAREGPGQDLLPLPDRQSQLPWGLQVSHASSYIIYPTVRQCMHFSVYPSCVLLFCTSRSRFHFNHNAIPYERVHYSDSAVAWLKACSSAIQSHHVKASVVNASACLDPYKLSKSARHASNAHPVASAISVALAIKLTICICKLRAACEIMCNIMLFPNIPAQNAASSCVPVAVHYIPLPNWSHPFESQALLHSHEQSLPLCFSPCLYAGI